MSRPDFSSIETSLHSAGADAALDTLVEQLRASGEYHNLFDALLLRRKFQLGLPLSRPTSLKDVAAEAKAEMEAAYADAAEEVGDRFLAAGDIPAAWMYLQVVRKPEKVVAALDALPDDVQDYEQTERLLQIALFQAVHPEKGVRMMLRSHGTCNTVTSLDQVFPQITPEQRSSCARLLVRHLYEELSESLRHHIQQKMPMVEADASLMDLLRGRDWLFEGGNYHIDVSHLNSVVRFSRSIMAPAEELEMARQLAEYGSRLHGPLQYPGDPPFEDFYPAHLHFLNVILNREREAGLQYFRDKLTAEPDERDRPLLAYVLVDLLMRCDRYDEAVQVAIQELSSLGEEVSLSIDELCEKAGRWQDLRQLRQDQGDLVGFTSALVRQSQANSAAASS